MKDVILIDKPAGWTSFDVVAKIRGKIRADYKKRGETPTKKQLRVGHAGTLDPFATGLLIILLGEACKDAATYLKLDKTYEFTAKLGEVSSTGDPEGEITRYGDSSKQQIANRLPDAVILNPVQDLVKTTKRSGSAAIPVSNFHNPTSEEVQQVLRQFTGEITQTPPAFSAIKVNGQRAYKLARDGKAVEIPSRTVKIDRLELIEYNYPYLKCVCDVSSGTYIRSLVADIGRALDTGAYCIELRRTRIGPHHIENAKSEVNTA